MSHPDKFVIKLKALGPIKFRSALTVIIFPIPQLFYWCPNKPFELTE